MYYKGKSIQYEFYSENPFSHFLDIRAVFPVDGVQELTLSVSYWRPGRYEPGNFAKNIRGLVITDEKGKKIPFRKTSKQTWLVRCNGAEKIILKYQYYSSELNAGSCYVDNHQIFVNPVHCVFYCKEMMDVPYEISVQKPASFRVVCPLPEKNGTFFAKNFEHLADSPMVASSLLRTHSFSVRGVPFFLHINGVCDPDFAQLEHDFKLFIETHFNFWEEIPFESYHFIFQITPYVFYHGVEHANSTVIAIGPGYEIYSRRLYMEVLGISSHELFHAWNIKTLRPADMLPYDYSQENYSELGFVYEGFTTYFGDKLLMNAGLYSYQDFLHGLSLRLRKHIHNSGRFNYSVMESSFDTWLDGYMHGIPGRKTSIYDEGCLAAFMLDAEIFRQTKGFRGLKSVCRRLWNRFGNLKKGYTFADVKELAIQEGGEEVRKIFEEYIEKPADYFAKVKELLSYLGVELILRDPEDLWERYIGLRWEKGSMGWRVTSVCADSPAWKAGIYSGDELFALNGKTLTEHPGNWLRHYLFTQKAEVTIMKKNELLHVPLEWNLNISFFLQPFAELRKVESNDRLFLKFITA